MLNLSDFSASPLFWAAFWPCLSFAAAAVMFFAFVLTARRI